MSLPIDFVASATALKCYEVCARKFQHRYLDHVPTAGPDAESAEQMQRGELFHRLVLWHDLGLDTDVILQTADDPVLETQWAAYRSFGNTLGVDGSRVQHDQSLVARCGGFPVLAKVDALVVDPAGCVTIYDWKTTERPSPARFTDSHQSKVYPYVVWEVLRRRPGVALTDPAQVRLIYWFPSQPEEPLEIPYSPGRLAAGSGWLDGLLSTIASDCEFHMTTDRTRCQKCEYIVHCGVKPEDGDPLELDEDYHRTMELEDDSSFDHAVWPH
ncbi:MAG: PD-(D/E)XK nuclease family protein [Chloroflexia bacterium]|nr:PD-(D/E)XK nuclease family protein [Chloroflexia bacterium]